MNNHECCTHSYSNWQIPKTIYVSFAHDHLVALFFVFSTTTVTNLLFFTCYSPQKQMQYCFLFSLFFTLLCRMCRSCVVCHSNLMCSICNSAFLQLWSLPWDVCRCGSTVTTCDHGSSWSLHGNCSLFNMAHVVVQPCHTDLFTLVIHGCLDIAVTFDYTWQLQLSRHGNCSLSSHGNRSCPGMATAAVIYVPFS